MLRLFATTPNSSVYADEPDEITQPGNNEPSYGLETDNDANPDSPSYGLETNDETNPNDPSYGLDDDNNDNDNGPSYGLEPGDEDSDSGPSYGLETDDTNPEGSDDETTPNTCEDQVGALA